MTEAREISAPKPWKRSCAACTVLLTILGAIYWPVIGHDFVDFDDREYVAENQQVLSGLTPASIRWAFTSGEMANWHPLTWLSLQFDGQLYGCWPGGFHLTNLLLHAGGTLALYFAMHRMTLQPAASFCVALLYAIHPVHVESVAWISERKGILSTFFWMLAIVAYGWYSEHPSWQRMTLVSLLVALGMLAKQMLVSFPLAMLLLDRWPLGRTWNWGLIREKLPLFALTSGFIPIAYFAQSAGGAVGTTPLGVRLCSIPIAYASYLCDLAYPADLHIPYTADPSKQSVPLAITALLLLLFLAGVAWFQRMVRPYLLMGYAWFLLTAVPVIGIIPIGIQWRADRYLDIPSVGVYFAVVWAAAEHLAAAAPPLRRALLLLCGCVVLALAIVSHQQQQVWENSTSLWTNTVLKVPGHAVGMVNLGAALIKAGKVAQAYPILAEAVQHKLDLKSREMAEYNLGLACFQKGEIARSVGHYQAALAISPQSEKTLNNLGNAYYVLGRDHEAREVLSRAVTIRPDYAAAHYNLANVLLAIGDRSQAATHYTRALELTPADSALGQQVKQKLQAISGG